MQPNDLVILGGGLSGTLTLMHLVKELEKDPPAPPDGALWRIAMVDKNGDFGRGAPYGRRVHPAYLLNENGATMDVWGFRDWLARNHDDWTTALRRGPGAVTGRWFRFNESALEEGRSDPAAFDRMYLPRCVFGRFMEQTLDETLRRSRRQGSLHVERVPGEAIDVRRRQSGDFDVEIRDAASLRAGSVLLGLGSLPPDPTLPRHAACVPDLYAQDFDEVKRTVLAGVGEARESGRRRPARVLVLGSNAAAMEFLFSLANDVELCKVVEELTVLSTGTLPDGRPSGKALAFSPRHLRELAQAPQATAPALIEAARRDAATARDAGYTSLDFSTPLSKGLRRVFERMAQPERREFVDHHGMQFTALSYHTPPEYADAAAALTAGGKLTCVTACVEEIEERPDGALGVHARRGETRTSFRGDVVVNCRGSGPLERAEMPLLKTILAPRRGIARINTSGRGIHVDSLFEASPGVFVLGPLLAGHTSGEVGIWNLESAPRIDGYAARLAATIAARWRRGERGRAKR
jgi:uncharacterized NAD(P)/FAD-binding protein YdhS